MQGKENPAPLSWAYRNETIDGLVKLNLSRETQEALGCEIMEDVFLEYPWAYVPREGVIRSSRQDDSELAPFKDYIDKYEGESFLVGYASTELISSEFVICVTEAARNEIATRNKGIKKLLDRRVYHMFYKTPRPWVSGGSELEVGENVTKRQRPLFEVEISVPTELLGVDRELTDRKSTDAKDACMEIVPRHERFDLVPMSRLTTAAQTNLPGREAGVQTNFGFPKNAWTQYGYEYQTAETPEEIFGEDYAEEDKEDEADKEPGESVQVEETTGENAPPIERAEGEEETAKSQTPDPVNLFMEKYAEEMIDVIDYNAAMNLHVHDIDELVLKGKETRPTDEVVFEELYSFIDLGLTTGKVISDVSWHPTLSGVVVVCYAEIPNCDLVRGPSVLRNALSSIDGSGSVVLVWSLTDSMSPILRLDHDRPVSTVSFCPFRPDVVVAGCETGHLIIWDFAGRLNKCSVDSCCSEQQPEEKLHNDTAVKADREIASAIGLAAVSNDFQSHHGTVRRIEWLPPYHRVETDGRLIILPENTSLQFLTASEDGCVAVWDLAWESRALSSSAIERGSSRLSKILCEEFGTVTSELKRLDGLFRPIYSIYMQVPKEVRNLPLLSLLVQAPLIICEEVSSVHQTREPIFEDEKEEARFCTKTYRLNFTRTENECLKKFWAGSSEGDFLSCAWDGHEFTEVASSENCKYLGWSRVHDGPVTRITQSPHLPEVLLTVGGRAFAVWEQDFLRSPLLLRKGRESYTACCWTSRPGVFMVAMSNGDVETWDLRISTTECLAVQSISGGRITGLYPHVLPLEPNVVGVCDHNGALRVFREPRFFSDDKSARIEWLRDFVSREVKRKREFAEWEANYLKNDPHALQRKAARAADEAKRRHEEARAKFQKEQEELARIEEERRARMVQKSKAEKWRASDLDRMREILLAKKGFEPRELEATRRPLVQQEEERSKKLEKAEERAKDSEVYFKDAISLDLPKLPGKRSPTGVTDVVSFLEEKPVDEKIIQGRLQYEKIRDEARKKMSENFEPRVFDPKQLTSDGRRRRRELDVEYLRRSRKEERLRKMKTEIPG